MYFDWPRNVLFNSVVEVASALAFNLCGRICTQYKMRKYQFSMQRAMSIVNVA